MQLVMKARSSIGVINGFKAFTLVEMLIGISIVGILIAFLTLGARKAIGMAGNVNCVNNLRQIGTAFHTYAADNSGYFPQVQNTNGAQWYDVMRETLPSSKIYVCPTAKYRNPEATSSSTASYAYGMVDSSSGLAVAKVDKPSQKFLIAEGVQIGTWQSAGSEITYEWGDVNHEPTPDNYDTDDSTMSGWIRYRHGGAANILFIDGHVEGFTKQNVQKEIENGTWEEHWKK